MGVKWVLLFFVVLLASFVLGVEENVVLLTYLDEEVYIGQEYDKLFKIKIDGKKEARGCSEKDLITVNYNITSDELVKEDVFSREIGCSGTANTGEFIPSLAGDYVLCGEIVNTSTAGNVDLSDDEVCMNFTVLDTSEVVCDISLDITTNGTFVYQEGESIKFKTELNDKSFPFEIEYWIEDLLGTYYKNPYVSTNTNQKSWKTKIEEEDRVLLIKAEVTPSCADVNLSDNYAEEMFVVIGSVEEEVLEGGEEEESSSIEIIKVKPDEIEFGDLVNAEVEIYKNSTGKYSLSAWIEKSGKVISYKTKFHLKSKDTVYKLFLPIQLKPNCNEKIKGGEASLIVEGLDERAEKEISVSGINGDLCKEVKESSDSVKESPYQIVDLPISVFSGEELEVIVKLVGDSKEHDYKAWAYLYRGSKCYSCGDGERNSNLIEFGLDEYEEKEVKLVVKVDLEMEEGDYKLKVKLNKDGQKTDKELTENIYVKTVERKESEESLDLLGESGVEEELVNKRMVEIAPVDDDLDRGKGIVVYESSSEKAKKLLPYIIIIVLGLVCSILIWKRI